MLSSAFSLPGPSGSTSSTPLKQISALITSAQHGEATRLYALAATLQRTHLLHALAASTGDEEEERATTATLSRLAKLTTSSLTQAPYAGAKLATLQLRSEPASAHAQPWASAALSALLLLAERGNRQRRNAARGKPLADLLELADQLLGKPAKADERAEYKRAVVTPALPRFATALVGLLECMADESHADECLPVLSALTTHLVAHPSAYRPHTPRLNKTLQALLFTTASTGSATTQAAIVKLAAALHRTGSSARTNKSSGGAGAGTTETLWAATIAAPLTAARAAWNVVSSAFAASQQPPQNETDASLFPDALSSDPLEALGPALQRLEVLLGSDTHTGVVPLLLAQETLGSVVVPLEALLNLSIRILSLGPAPAARSPPPDTELLARQTSSLPRAQSGALRLLAACLLAVPRAALVKRTPEIVSALLELMEDNRTAPSLRASAAATLALALSSRKLESCSARVALTGAALQLDPASSLVTRTARICIVQLAKWIAHPSAASIATASSSSANNGGAGRKKRARYESDAIGLGLDAVAQGLVSLTLDETYTANAALEILTSLEPLLATELTPAHAVLRRTFALLLLSLGTLALASPGASGTGKEDLAQRTLSSLAALVREAEGAMLSLLLARTAHLATLGLASFSLDVQREAKHLLSAAHQVTEPRLVPRLMRAPEERPAEWGVEEGEMVGAMQIAQDGTAEALVDLGLFAKPAHAQEGHAASLGAMGQTASPTSSAALGHACASPRSSSAQNLPSPSAFSHVHSHVHPHAHAGPRNSDPVKPTHRPHTPRIGSPASPERALSSIGIGAGGPSGGASPARAVFGAPPPTTPSATAGTDKTALAAPASQLPVVMIPSSVATNMARQESEDEDEEMPSIDLGDSDDEDGEQQAGL